MFAIITGAIARGSAFFGPGVDPIHLDDVQCTGSESSLFDCTANTIHNCNHLEDAGVECMQREWLAVEPL